MDAVGRSSQGFDPMRSLLRHEKTLAGLPFDLPLPRH